MKSLNTLCKLIQMIMAPEKPHDPPPAIQTSINVPH